MDAKALSKKYYPVYWPIERLKALVGAGKLSETDYKEVTGQDYVAVAEKEKS